MVSGNSRHWENVWDIDMEADGVGGERMIFFSFFLSLMVKSWNSDIWSSKIREKKGKTFEEFRPI